MDQMNPNTENTNENENINNVQQAGFDFEDAINNRANAMARDHIFHAMFSRMALTYDRTFPPAARRILEFFLLITALMALFILIYIHVAFVKSPITCLDHINLENLASQHSRRSDSKNSVIRVEILTSPPNNYTLIQSYEKEYERILPKQSVNHKLETMKLRLPLTKMTFVDIVCRKCSSLNQQYYQQSTLLVNNLPIKDDVYDENPDIYSDNSITTTSSSSSSSADKYDQTAILRNNKPDEPGYAYNQNNAQKHDGLSHENSESIHPSERSNNLHKNSFTSKDIKDDKSSKSGANWFFDLFNFPINPILEQAEYWREKLSVKAMAPFRQTFNELELFAKSVFTEEKYIMEYSIEYGLLRLSPTVRQKLKIPVHFIILDANKDKCFGGPLSRFLLQEFVGYDQIIIGSLKKLAEKQNGKGFVRNVVSGEHYRFVNSWMSRTSYLAAGFIMIIFTLSVSMLLRYSHHQIFVFIVDLLRMLENNLQLSFPAAPLLTVVLALVGMEAIMSEFFNDTSTAFYTIVIIWLADQYEAVCCRTYISKYHWPKYFYLYHFAFYAYHYRFNGQFSGLALLCSWLFIQHSMCFFFHHYELPRLLQGMAVRNVVENVLVATTNSSTTLSSATNSITPNTLNITSNATSTVSDADSPTNSNNDGVDNTISIVDDDGITQSISITETVSSSSISSNDSENNHSSNDDTASGNLVDQCKDSSSLDNDHKTEQRSSFTHTVSSGDVKFGKNESHEDELEVFKDFTKETENSTNTSLSCRSQYEVANTKKRFDDGDGDDSQNNNNNTSNSSSNSTYNINGNIYANGTTNTNNNNNNTDNKTSSSLHQNNKSNSSGNGILTQSTPLISSQTNSNNMSYSNYTPSLFYTNTTPNIYFPKRRPQKLRKRYLIKKVNTDIQRNTFVSPGYHEINKSNQCQVPSQSEESDREDDSDSFYRSEQRITKPRMFIVKRPESLHKQKYKQLAKIVPVIFECREDFILYNVDRYVLKCANYFLDDFKTQNVMTNVLYEVTLNSYFSIFNEVFEQCWKLAFVFNKKDFILKCAKDADDVMKKHKIKANKQELLENAKRMGRKVDSKFIRNQEVDDVPYGHFHVRSKKVNATNLKLSLYPSMNSIYLSKYTKYNRPLNQPVYSKPSVYQQEYPYKTRQKNSFVYPSSTVNHRTRKPIHHLHTVNPKFPEDYDINQEDFKEDLDNENGDIGENENEYDSKKIVLLDKEEQMKINPNSLLYPERTSTKQISYNKKSVSIYSNSSSTSNSDPKKRRKRLLSKTGHVLDVNPLNQNVFVENAVSNIHEWLISKNLRQYRSCIVYRNIIDIIMADFFTIMPDLVPKSITKSLTNNITETTQKHVFTNSIRHLGPIIHSSNAIVLTLVDPNEHDTLLVPFSADSSPNSIHCPYRFVGRLYRGIPNKMLIYPAISATYLPRISYNYNHNIVNHHNNQIPRRLNRSRNNNIKNSKPAQQSRANIDNFEQNLDEETLLHHDINEFIKDGARHKSSTKTTVAEITFEQDLINPSMASNCSTLQTKKAISPTYKLDNSATCGQVTAPQIEPTVNKFYGYLQKLSQDCLLLGKQPKRLQKTPVVESKITNATVDQEPFTSLLFPRD